MFNFRECYYREEKAYNIITKCMFSKDLTWAGKCSVNAKKQISYAQAVSFVSKQQEYLCNNPHRYSNSTEYFPESQNIPSFGTTQETSLGAQPGSKTISESERWSGWSFEQEEPRFTISFKRVQRGLLEKWPFSYGWSTLDWPEKRAAPVFLERLLWGDEQVWESGPGDSFSDGSRRICSVLQCAAWWTVVCVPSVRRMVYEAAELRLLPPRPPK